ncbi:MAG: hypothetical protein QOD42_3352 [Sphingomonadales bacterium]|jgi:hypothetical protein|nr:hypothetical protein [Sphingomonadales bacterium]
MILKASQRGGGSQLGLHLLKTEENEHVEIHEVSGFVADSVRGAMKEAQALSRGTHCRQYLFSVSLNPPIGENARVETFEQALNMIEERLGLKGQPRVVVFHEKEGRRHCHAVWSRIDAATMTARPLPFFKTKLREIARQLFLENGWKMPGGFIDSKLRDPRSFTLDEWQQAKRAGLDAKALKDAAQEAWAVSDSAASFSKALEERGLFLARGDRRGPVAVTIDGDVLAVARLLGRKTKEVTARLGDPAALLPVAEVRRKLAGEMGQRLKAHIAEAKRIAANALRPLHQRREAIKRQHADERRRLDAGISKRRDAEQKQRAARIRSGVKGAWDLLTGRYWKARKQNEVEAFFAFQRDRAQRDGLIRDQLAERSRLQTDIQHARTRQARQLLALYRDAARFRQAQEFRAPVRDAGLDFGR